jgi:hypothetical protein
VIRLNFVTGEKFVLKIKGDIKGLKSKGSMGALLPGRDHFARKVDHL